MRCGCFVMKPNLFFTLLTLFLGSSAWKFHCYFGSFECVGLARFWWLKEMNRWVNLCIYSCSYLKYLIKTKSPWTSRKIRTGTIFLKYEYLILALIVRLERHPKHRVASDIYKVTDDSTPFKSSKLCIKVFWPRTNPPLWSPDVTLPSSFRSKSYEISHWKPCAILLITTSFLSLSLLSSGFNRALATSSRSKSLG